MLRREYQRITNSEREELSRYLAIGRSLTWISKELGRHRHKFDQQPEETASMIEALKTMYDISKDSYYQRFVQRAFDWFLGDNMLGQIIYDQTTGGCYDGLREHEVNLNEGAESTLSYLLSRLLL